MRESLNYLLKSYLYYPLLFVFGSRNIFRVQKKNLTYLDAPCLLDLYNTIRHLERKKIKGIFIEAGCALGGSAIVIASAKKKNRSFYIYDVFGMIPPPSFKDGNDVHKRYDEIKNGRSAGLGGEKYYGYLDNLIDIVKSNFATCNLNITYNNINLIKGLFQDTLKIKQKVAFAHIDGDWYESVMICLKEIEPFLAVQGVLVVDDYYFYSGCRTAVDEYFSDKRNQYLFKKRNRLHIIKLLVY
jgi:Macrocin-O-methyltransferase (TylF)